MYACKVDDVHPVDGGEICAVIALEDFLGEVDHLLDGDVEPAADAFEKGVNDMKVNDEDVSIDRGLHLQTLVFREEGQQEIPQLLGYRLQIDLLLVQDGLVDLLLDVAFAVVEFRRQLVYQGAHLLVLDELFGVALSVPPKPQRQLLALVKLVVLGNIHVHLFEVFIGFGELRLAW